MFLVVETVNDKGEKDWKVAPKRWVCTTKNTRRTVLLWPSDISSEWQQHLAKEGICKPMKSWSRKECIVKQECPTYDGANTALKVLVAQGSPTRNSMQAILGESSMKKKGLKIQQDVDPLDTDASAFDNEHTTPVILIEVPPENASTAQTIPHGDTSILATIKDMVESLMKRSANIERQNAYLMRKMDEIEERLIEDGPTNSSSREKKPDFNFEPMKTHEEVRCLEQKLGDDSFRLKLMEWLEWNIVETVSEKRMSSCLNLLMTKELQLKCTWTGRSRIPEESPLGICELRNLKELFKTIGTTQTERVNGKKLSICFMKKLRNVKKHKLRCSKRSESRTMVDSSFSANDNETSASIFEES